MKNTKTGLALLPFKRRLDFGNGRWNILEKQDWYFVDTARLGSMTGITKGAAPHRRKHESKGGPGVNTEDVHAVWSILDVIDLTFWHRRDGYFYLKQPSPPEYIIKQFSHGCAAFISSIEDTTNGRATKPH